MSYYRRANGAGGTYFFTVVTYRRRSWLTDNDARQSLRQGIALARRSHPFEIDAWVLLPDHLHCVWTLPPGDANFAVRWAIIKRHATRCCGARLHRDDWMSASKNRRHEATLWQRRYWEHQIRNEADFRRHIDYLHWNPVKHGYVDEVAQWPYSTFHRHVRDGVYPMNWGGQFESDGAIFGE
jgi:putative transposase